MCKGKTSYVIFRFLFSLTLTPLQDKIHGQLVWLKSACKKSNNFSLSAAQRTVKMQSSPMERKFDGNTTNCQISTDQFTQTILETVDRGTQTISEDFSCDHTPVEITPQLIQSKSKLFQKLFATFSADCILDDHEIESNEIRMAQTTPKIELDTPVAQAEVIIGKAKSDNLVARKLPPRAICRKQSSSPIISSDTDTDSIKARPPRVICRNKLRRSRLLSDNGSTDTSTVEETGEIELTNEASSVESNSCFSNVKVNKNEGIKTEIWPETSSVSRSFENTSGMVFLPAGHRMGELRVRKHRSSRYYEPNWIKTEDTVGVERGSGKSSSSNLSNLNNFASNNRHQKESRTSLTNAQQSNSSRNFSDIRDSVSINDHKRQKSRNNFSNLQKLDLLLTRKQEIKQFVCQCNTCDKWASCPTWLTVNFGSDADSNKSSPLLGSNPPKSVETQKQFTGRYLIHGQLIPQPMKSWSDFCVNDDIREVLESIGSFSSSNLHAHTWVAILRCLNVCIVASSKYNRTFGYLPIICGIAKRDNEIKPYGPSVIILGKSEKQCERVYLCINELLKNIKNIKEKPLVGLVIDSIENMEICDMVVTTPAMLETLLKSYKITLKHLSRLVVESADVLLKTCPEIMRKLFLVLDRISKNRVVPYKTLQIITTSENWSLDLENLVKKLYAIPTIYFDNYLEAASYFKVKFVVKKLKPAFKKFYLEDHLKQNFATFKTIVFCDDDEISELCDYLTHSGINIIEIKSQILDEELNDNINVFNYDKIGHYKVLVCTDRVFLRLGNLKNVSRLVHFSIPVYWQTFVERFGSIVEYLAKSFENDSNGIQCTSLLMVDETCTLEKPTLSKYYEALIRNSVQHFHF